MATLRDLVAQVATAYFSNVNVSAADIPAVMSAIAGSLSAVDETPGERPDDAPADDQRSPNRPEVQRSVTPEALISFEDGRPYKTLRRHLAARGLTPAQYRAKYNLPADYPMVAPNTSAARSQLARAIGLGGRTSPAPSNGDAPTTPRRPGRPKRIAADKPSRRRR